GTHAFWGGQAPAADDFSARGTRCALPHSHWSAGTPPRAWPLLPSACFAQPDSTPPTPHRAQTAAYGGARPTHAAALLLSPSESKPRDRDTMREGHGRDERRIQAELRP